jgi:ankyrin repeat protein
LTNLQRGNTEADVQAEICLSFHERSGQGEITDEQARQQPFIDAVDSNEFSALHWSCFYGQLSSVRILVKYGANISKQAPDMITPLLLAAAGGHHEIARLLLQNGAEVNHMDIVSKLLMHINREFIILSRLLIFHFAGGQYGVDVCGCWKSPTYLQ